MTPERFRQIEELFHAARAASPGDRADLMARADADVRRAVEALLSQRADGDFLNRAAVENAAEVFADPRVNELESGAQLGPYRIERKLGEGGMGEVFRAIDTRLGRPVAIKFAHERFTTRFDREVRAIAALNHPHICTLHDVGPNYLVMELLEGETIAAHLKRGPIPSGEAVQYARQIVSALAEAHEHGIIHRDLKPGNVMLVKSGVKVLDFGLATWEGDETITGSQMVIGTAAYMAPEQRTGKPADVRSDIYSFGCLFYEMLTASRAGSDRKPIGARSLEAIVNRCLETDPARRWQSAVELGRALESPRSMPRVAIAAVTVLAIAMIAGAYSWFRPAPKLADKAVVVLGDFVNSTSDRDLDVTLRQALATQLEPMPFLKIMDDDQVHRLLRLMTLPADSRLTEPVAQELCIRAGAAVSIDGAVTSLGRNYVITLRAVACQDGATVAREQSQAEDKEHVVTALGSATKALGVKLEGALKSSPKATPLPQVTTHSLEALRIFATAQSQMLGGQIIPAVAALDRALAIDPDFASADLYLGVAAESAGEMARFRDFARKAYLLKDRISEFERAEIVPYYYRATGEAYKEIDAYQLGARTYPSEWSFRNQLSVVYIDIGQYEQGLQEGIESSRLSPNIEQPYRRQLDAYLCLGKLAEAKKVADIVRAKGIGQTRIHQRFLEIAYIEQDQSAIDKEIQWFAGKPEEYISFGLQAANLNMHGRRRESHDLYMKAVDVARHRELVDVAAELEEADARAAALSGDCDSVRRLGRPALALALCGDETRARKLIAETFKVFPNGTIWKEVQLPSIIAAIAMNHNKPVESVAALSSAAAYERAFPEAPYLRGLAYLRQRKGAEAVAEFRKIVDNKGASWAAAWRYPYQVQYYSFAHLQLARALTAAGDTAAAQRAYQDLFALWKDADADLVVYKQAKAEYSSLQ